MTIIDPSVSLSSSGSGSADFLYMCTGTSNIPNTISDGDGSSLTVKTVGNSDSPVMRFKSRPVLYQISSIGNYGPSKTADYIISYDVDAQLLSEHLSEIIHTNYIGEFSVNISVLRSSQTPYKTHYLDVVSDGETIQTSVGIDGDIESSVSNTYLPIYVTDFDIPW